MVRTIDRLFVGGTWRTASPSTHTYLDIVNPASEELMVRVAEPAAADIDDAVSAARRAFDDSDWRWLPPTERAHFLALAAKELERRWPGELAPAFTLETGTPTFVAQQFHHGSLGIFADGARLAESYQFEEDVEGVAKAARLIREPIGVVGAIAPWNGQLYLTLSKLVPALVAGCTVVAKPSPETAMETEVLCEALEAAGIPKGVVSVFAGGREAGAHLVDHPDVDLVAFTGSCAAGKAVMASAAKQLARVSLELGGKSPGIVLDDAETAELIPQLLSGTTLMTGQACALLSRILVPRERYAEIVDAYASALSAVPFGDPNDPANLMGPLVSRTGYDRALDLIESARSEGARVVVGGGRPAEYPKGWYVEPTVIADVHNQMRIAREEVFGPVISFLPYDGEEDAVKIANDTDFGLAAAVFGRDRERAGRVAKRVRAGVVTVNGFALDPGIAFGGFKQSGIGREGGVAGMHTYTEVKALHLDAASEAAPLLR